MDQIERDPHVDPGRLDALSSALAAEGFAAAIVSHPRDVLYFAGTAQPANLLVVPGHAPTLFARRFADLARAQTHVGDVREAPGLSAVSARLDELGVQAGVVGLALDAIPASLADKARGTLAPLRVEPVDALLAERRMIKDEAEIAALRRAADLYTYVHAAIAAYARPGATELEVAAELAAVLRRAGHDGLTFHRRWDAQLHPEGALASGPNLWTFSGQAISITGVGLTRAVPFGASERVLRTGDLLNLDLGLVRDGYHADMARTYVLGAPSAEVRELAAAVRAIHAAALAAVAPGVPARAPYDAAREVARDRGVEAFFQGHGDAHGPYIGHAIGLELDEPPVLGPGARTPLRAGMVLTIEPKLTVPGVGAVNLEDDLVVRDDGPELLSAIPADVFSISHGRLEAIA